MKHTPLDSYESFPRPMRQYLSRYGFHFSKRAYELACDSMIDAAKTRELNKPVKVKPYTREQVDNLLNAVGIELKNKVLYDYVFAATMCRADYFGSSVPDERHLALFVRDYVDDPDGSDEIPFRRWLATNVGNGTPIDFSDLLD